VNDKTMGDDRQTAEVVLDSGETAPKEFSLVSGF
jgi:hypothetical protein